ncbi:MAG: riboflavin synthase [Acidobacteriota bacterium]
MFTGIVEELGKVVEITPQTGGLRLSIAARTVLSDLKTGDSVAVNGVCLTAVEVGTSDFSADLSQETLDRSSLGSVSIDSPVNLERAVTPTTRLGGHIVQGHVDGRGKFVSAVKNGDYFTVTVEFPPELARYFVYKGSVCVDGISLTIAKLSEREFEIAVIPKTWDVTNLSALRPGDPVNLEADIIAKYVGRLLSVRTEDDRDTISMDTLRNAGFL